MKKSIYILFLLVASYTANAQVSGKHMGSTGVGGDLSIQDNNGKMIPIGAKEDTKGNPLFLENWVNGKVNLKNGITFNDSALNFSLFEDKLYFKRDNQFFIVAGIINDFYLANANSTAYLYHFVSGYPASSNTNENTFFQLLSDGKNYQLLKWQHKKIREVYNYGGVNESEYVNQEAYYVFQKSTHNLFNIAANKANTLQIKNTLSVDESIWKAYLNNHTNNTKGESGMVEFISYLNGL